MYDGLDTIANMGRMIQSYLATVSYTCRKILIRWRLPFSGAVDGGVEPTRSLPLDVVSYNFCIPSEIYDGIFVNEPSYLAPYLPYSSDDVSAVVVGSVSCDT